MASNGKLPWFQFYPSDWIQDTRMLDLQSKGAWFEIINAMWTASERGVISGTLEEFSLLLGCYIDVTSELLDRFERLKICDFERGCNGLVTIKCRRMVREEAERRNTRERVAKFRGKKVCNGHVTPYVTDKKSEVIYQKTEEEEKKPPLSPKGEQLRSGCATNGNDLKLESLLMEDFPKAKQPPRHMIVDYLKLKGSPESDADSIEAGWNQNGFKLKNGRAIQDWKANIDYKIANGFLPSQKLNGNSNGHHPTSVSNGWTPPAVETCIKHAESRRLAGSYGKHCWKHWTGNNWKHFGETIKSDEQWKCLIDTRAIPFDP